MKPLSRIDWLKTPYADSKAQNPDADVAKLLDRYGVNTRQWTEHDGPHGRPAVTLRFVLREKAYRFGVETLAADRVERRELVRQAKRVLYWHLKSTLETLLVFMPPEQAMLPFLECADGRTAYESVQPHLGGMIANQLESWATTQRPALPPPR